MKKSILFFSLCFCISGMVLFAEDKGFIKDKGFKSGTATMSDRMMAIIDFHSGTPNPQFVITDEKLARKIRDFAKDLPKHPSKKTGTVMNPISGYHGITVLDGSRTADFPQINIYHSDVHLLRMNNLPGSLTDFRLDEGENLENLVLDSAEKNGILDKELKKMIKSSKVFKDTSDKKEN
jgi:hypothetical protein